MAGGMRLFQRTGRAIDKRISTIRERIRWQTEQEPLQILPKDERIGRPYGEEPSRTPADVQDIERLYMIALERDLYDARTWEEFRTMAERNRGNEELAGVAFILLINYRRRPFHISEFADSLLRDIDEHSIVPSLIKLLEERGHDGRASRSSWKSQDYTFFSKGIMGELWSSMEIGHAPLLFSAIGKQVLWLKSTSFETLLFHVQRNMEQVLSKCRSREEAMRFKQVLDESGDAFCREVAEKDKQILRYFGEAQIENPDFSPVAPEAMRCIARLKVMAMQKLESYRETESAPYR